MGRLLHSMYQLSLRQRLSSLLQLKLQNRDEDVAGIYGVHCSLPRTKFIMKGSNTDVRLHLTRDQIQMVPSFKFMEFLDLMNWELQVTDTSEIVVSN